MTIVGQFAAISDHLGSEPMQDLALRDLLQQDEIPDAFLPAFIDLLWEMMAGQEPDPTWQAWLDLCDSAPRSDVRSFRDLRDEQYVR